MRTGDVQADETLAAGPVEGAGADHQPSLIEQPFRKPFRTRTGGPAVDPCQIGAFERQDGVLRQVFLEIPPQEAVVFPEVCPQGVEPLRSLVVGGRQCRYAQRVDVADFVVIDRPVDAASHPFVGGDDVGDLHPGQGELQVTECRRNSSDNDAKGV